MEAASIASLIYQGLGFWPRSCHYLACENLSLPSCFTAPPSIKMVVDQWSLSLHTLRVSGPDWSHLCSERLGLAVQPQTSSSFPFICINRSECAPVALHNAHTEWVYLQKNVTSNKSVEHTQTPKFSLLADGLQGPRPVSWLRNTMLHNHLFMYTDRGRKH